MQMSSMYHSKIRLNARYETKILATRVTSLLKEIFMNEKDLQRALRDVKIYCDTIFFEVS